MELVDKIEPAEVLAHLKQMGYNNITPAQLKEFIKDLKKLIVYDQLSSSSDSLTSLSSSMTSDSEYFSSKETSDSSKVFEGLSSLKKNTHSQGVLKEKSIQKPPLTTSNTSCTSGSNGGLRKSSCSSSSISGTRSSVHKENQSQPCQRIHRTKSMSSEDIQEAVKPRTSFIRPWQLRGTGQGQGGVTRSDPVSLYHYYRALWSRHKCPGEDSHADLRWVIRERMLGQDPHLYGPTQNVFNPPQKHSRMRM